LAVLVVAVVLVCNAQVRALIIRPGMTSYTVIAIMGNPDFGWGLPRKGAGKSHFFYSTIGNRYVVVIFKDDRVADPPTDVWSKDDFVE
jgi:hypothetical protein